MIWITYFAAILCVVTRGALNVMDRFYFKKSSSFINGLMLNAVYPFLVALLIGLYRGVSLKTVSSLLFIPGIFFSALGAQLAASIYSYAFKSMSVRSVVFSAKFADLFIPLFLIPITFRFDMRFYVFSCATSFLFIPFIYAVRRSKETYNYKIVASIIGISSAQAMINAYFNISKISTSWIEFVATFIAISFYRLVITMIAWTMSVKKTMVKNKIPMEEHLFLFSRATVACISQGAFFYSITRINGNEIWPILNVSPFAASVFAARFLKEKFGKLEAFITIGFCSLLSIYLLRYRAF